MAKALKLLGNSKLYCVCESFYYDEDIFEGIFDDVLFYKSSPFAGKKWFASVRDNYPGNFKKMLQHIRNINPDIIISYAEPYDHTAFVLKQTNYPVVLCDGADFTGISSGIENLAKKTAEEEKYCFENVKGIVFKGPENTLDYYRENNYKIKAKELSWFDHADQDHFIPENFPKLSDEDGELHMVYTGNISVNPEINYIYYIPLAEALSQQKIHLHIYPNPYQFKTSRIYRSLDQNSNYFHFHAPVPQKDLAKEIAKYDWGLWIHSAQKSTRTQLSKIKIGMVNKLFSYLEAGLPVIVSDSRTYGKKIVEENNIGFSINDADWDKFAEKIAGFNYKELIDTVLRVRMQYSLQKNGYRLAEFLNKIIEGD